MIEAILLGNAQDAGVPQTGCGCRNCSAAWGNRSARRLVSCLGLLDSTNRQWFLIDATPDLREQWHSMQERAGEAVCAGILLTHAHIGHYTGLIHLGYEAMCSRALPVYATASMSRFLRSHAPWRQLVEMNNITLIELEPDQPEWLTDRLCIEPVPVPHRAEWSDTVGFIVGGPNRRLLYVPDIDAWGRWERDVRKVVEGVDIALLDGTFFSADELSGRDATAIGHPLVTATVERLQGVNTDVRFIHLNHSNPLHREGESLDWLLSRGFAVGQMGDCWEL